MKHIICANCFVLYALIFFGISQAEEPPMRGVVLSVQDLETVNWPKLAHENGINTIGTHIFPKQVAEFMQTEKGKQFLVDCKKYGIMVEHQLHAISDLLPRDLFEQDPSMFRMNSEGKRVNDSNLCIHSEKALDLVAKNARHYAEWLPADNHRYYFWLDDGTPVCECPECSRYSASEQALIVENRIIRELRKFDPEAQLAHLAYHSTIPAPRKVKPEPGIFLEFAPFSRVWDKPLADINAAGKVAHKEYLQHLQENLEVFPVETAVILEYWLDVSLFSGWKKPAVQLPWNKAVCESDLKTYASFGIKNFTTFAVYIDDEYLKNYDNDLQFLKEYGELLNNLNFEDESGKEISLFIENETLRLAVASQGAEPQSLYGVKNGLEYLWQGDAKFWGSRSPILFPIIGRVQGGKYSWQDQTYTISMPHGFAKDLPFELESREPTQMRFLLKSSDETKKQYPFDFEFRVEYVLEENSLEIRFRVDNTGSQPMPFAWGAHPGFRVPLKEGEKFEDYRFDFAEKESPQQLLLDGVFMSGKKSPFPLKNGVSLELQHRIFDDEAIILENIKNRTMFLVGPDNHKRWSLQFDDFEFLALWQPEKTVAPFVSLEPWTGLPDPSDKTISKLDEKIGMKIVSPGDFATAKIRFTLFD